MEIHYESIWFFLFPFSLNSLGLSLNRLGDNIGVTVTVGVWESMVVVGESMVCESWGLGLNSFDYRLHNWYMGIGISGVHTMGGCWESIGDSRTSIGSVACKESSLSFGFSLNRLGDDIGIPK